MHLLTLLGSTPGKVHPAPEKWATSATKMGHHHLLHKVHNYIPLYPKIPSSEYCNLPSLQYVTHSQYDGWMLFLSSVEQGFCSDPWIPYNGHCFFLQRTPKTWSDAVKACRKEHGDLVSIRNVEDQGFVISQLGYST